MRTVFSTDEISSSSWRAHGHAIVPRRTRPLARWRYRGRHHHRIDEPNRSAAQCEERCPQPHEERHKVAECEPRIKLRCAGGHDFGRVARQTPRIGRQLFRIPRARDEIERILHDCIRVPRVTVRRQLFTSADDCQPRWRKAEQRANLLVRIVARQELDGVRRASVLYADIFRHVASRVATEPATKAATTARSIASQSHGARDGASDFDASCQSPNTPHTLASQRSTVQIRRVVQSQCSLNTVLHSKSIVVSRLLPRCLDPCPR